jgi:hypothetical protein
MVTGAATEVQRNSGQPPMLRQRPNERPGHAVFGQVLRHLVSFPLMREPKFDPGDLQVLVVAFDAVGEVMDMARERMGRGDPMAAVHLLAGVRVPVPTGLPGRVYHQELLAQARPLAALGVWHRLAVSRWSVLIMGEIARGAIVPAAAGFAIAPGVPASRVDGGI